MIKEISNLTMLAYKSVNVLTNAKFFMERQEVHVPIGSYGPWVESA